MSTWYAKGIIEWSRAETMHVHSCEQDTRPRAAAQPPYSLRQWHTFCRLASRSSFRPSRARVSDTLGAEVPEIHGWLRMSSGLMRSWGRIASMLRTSCLHEADSDDQCSSSRDACAASLIEPRMSSRCRGPGGWRKDGHLPETSFIITTPNAQMSTDCNSETRG
eukprot:scaffold80372_cov36-Tisochrysis_lutea.AAC.1